MDFDLNALVSVDVYPPALSITVLDTYNFCSNKKCYNFRKLNESLNVINWVTVLFLKEIIYKIKSKKSLFNTLRKTTIYFLSRTWTKSKKSPKILNKKGHY